MFANNVISHVWLWLWRWATPTSCAVSAVVCGEATLGKHTFAFGLLKCFVYAFYRQTETFILIYPDLSRIVITNKPFSGFQMT